MLLVGLLGTIQYATLGPGDNPGPNNPNLDLMSRGHLLYLGFSPLPFRG